MNVHSLGVNLHFDRCKDLVEIIGGYLMVNLLLFIGSTLKNK